MALHPNFCQLFNGIYGVRRSDYNFRVMVAPNSDPRNRKKPKFSVPIIQVRSTITLFRWICSTKRYSSHCESEVKGTILKAFLQDCTVERLGFFLFWVVGDLIVQLICSFSYLHWSYERKKIGNIGI